MDERIRKNINLAKNYLAKAIQAAYNACDSLDNCCFRDEDQTTCLTFDQALRKLFDGKKVARPHWRNADSKSYIAIEWGNVDDWPRPFIYEFFDGRTQPWIPAMDDFFADTWEVVED